MFYLLSIIHWKYHTKTNMWQFRFYIYIYNFLFYIYLFMKFLFIQPWSYQLYIYYVSPKKNVKYFSSIYVFHNKVCLCDGTFNCRRNCFLYVISWEWFGMLTSTCSCHVLAEHLLRNIVMGCCHIWIESFALVLNVW